MSATRQLLILLSSLALIAGFVPQAVRASEATVPAHIAKEVSGARLAGEGEFRWFAFKLYDAQLWVGPQGYQPSAPAAAPFALDLIYARNLNGKRIAGASRDELKKLGLGSEQQRAEWLTVMENLFPNVQDGTRLTGVFLPATGARFYGDGKLLGEVRDTEFARAFFAIWLDPRTPAPELRAALLGNAAPR